MEPFNANIEAIEVHKHHKYGQYSDHMSRMIPKIRKARPKGGINMIMRIYEDKMQNGTMKKKGIDSVFFDGVRHVLRDPKDGKLLVVASAGSAKVPVWIIALRFQSARDCDRLVELIGQNQTAHISTRIDSTSSSSSSSSSSSERKSRKDTTSSSSSSSSSSSECKPRCKSVFVDTTARCYRSRTQPRSYFGSAQMGTVGVTPNTATSYVNAGHGRCRSLSWVSSSCSCSSRCSSCSDKERCARAISVITVDRYNPFLHSEPAQIFVFDRKKHVIEPLAHRQTHSQRPRSQSRQKPICGSATPIYTVKELPRSRY